MYYKYLIPKLNHLLKTEDSVPVYKTANQLYYDDGNIYHAKNDHSTLEDLKENSTRIVDLTDLWDLQGTQTFSFQKRIFSVCKLQKCLVSLQDRIMNDTGKCIDKVSEQDRQTRDFLLASMYVFDYLKDHDNYDEAQRILNNLLNCTGSLCREEYNTNNCNCGKTIR